MKQTTECTILDNSKDIDLIEYTLKLYQNDRFGQIFSPAYLTEYICGLIDEKKPQSILVAEAEKGTTIVNLNHTDIMEMEIPLLSIEEQEELVAHYEAESTLYRETVSKAENRYLAEKEKIYERLL